jgi:hypothetical protein
MHAALRTAEPLSAPRPVTTDDVSAHAWQTWAALESGRLHDGFAGFERLSAEAELPVRGAWPGRFAQLDADPTATALFACTCAYGLVGIEPDAARHRLRIRPRLSARPGHTVVRGIRCGDATVSLEIVTEPDVVTIDVRQDDGAIPLTALLEPVLAAPVTTATVDHRPASLDISPLGDGFVVPVQLILDDVRSLRLKLANN